MAPTVGLSPRHIRRRISRYVPADGTQVTGQQASKMWNYFFSEPLVKLRNNSSKVNGQVILLTWKRCKIIYYSRLISIG